MSVETDARVDEGLRQVIGDFGTDDDTATMAACGLVRTAFRTPVPFATVADACGALASRRDPAIEKLRTHWKRISKHLEDGL